jgi:hypothetical protein
MNVRFFATALLLSGCASDKLASDAATGSVSAQIKFSDAVAANDGENLKGSDTVVRESGNVTARPQTESTRNNAEGKIRST